MSARLEVLAHHPPLGRMCDCESADCHPEARCPNKATAMVRTFGLVAALCDHCRRELVVAVAGGPQRSNLARGAQ